MPGFGSSVKYTPANASEWSISGTPQVKSGHRRPWQPGFFKRLPWAGILSIVLALGCAVAAITIAMESDGKPLDYWSIDGYAIQPSVLLAIFATIANALLVFAFTQGATIHWWNTAFKGASLKQLHSSYHYGSGLTAVFSSLTSFNTVAVAGIMMPILLMDGPLLQRATSVVSKIEHSQANATIPLTSSPFMQGTSGIMADHEQVPSLYHPLFAAVLQEYTNRESIVLPNRTCDGTCTVEVIAPGWDIECTETSEDFRLATYEESQIASNSSNSFMNGTERMNSTYDGPKPRQTTFSIDVILNETMSTDSQTATYGGMLYNLEFQVKYKSTQGERYTLVEHTCVLGEALVRYPLNLQNGTVTLGKMPSTAKRTVEKVYRQMEDGHMGDWPSTIGGFWLALSSHYKTQTTFGPVGGWYAARSSNPISSQYLRAPNASAISTPEVTWDNPMNDMISMANELAFRTALKTSTEVAGIVSMGATHDYYNLTSAQPYIISPNMTLMNRTVQQEAAMSSSTVVTVYATQRGWLAGGFVVICLACLAIVPTYWGWWRLGREVSMSPLEIARAFDAPIMRDADPNATGEDLKKEVGQKRVCLALLNGDATDSHV